MYIYNIIRPSVVYLVNHSGIVGFPHNNVVCGETMKCVNDGLKSRWKVCYKYNKSVKGRNSTNSGFLVLVQRKFLFYGPNNLQRNFK